MICVFAFGMQHTHPLEFSPSHLQTRKAYAMNEYKQDMDIANATMTKVWGTRF
jgi:hypothetical protein